MTALEALRDKVLEGQWPAEFLAIDSNTALAKVTTATLYRAFSGSLDAAKELHDALLPEWRMDAMVEHDNPNWSVAIEKLTGVYVFRRLPIPGRAWLAAILDALIMEESQL